MKKKHDTVQGEDRSAFAAVKQILHECQLEGVSLFEHPPVLRIQVSAAQFTRALELRETLVERIKPLGYRFIALDLDEL